MTKIDDYINQLNNKHGDTYKLIGEYKSKKKEALFLHKDCGNQFYAIPHNVLNSNRCCCPFCKDIKRFKTNDWFLNKANALYGDEYCFLSEYISFRSKILVRHNKCKREFKVAAEYIASGRLNCSYCFGNTLWDTERFKNKVFELVGNEYSVMSEYINSQTKIKMKHNSCGNIFWIKPNSFIPNKGGCDLCRYNSIRKTAEQFYLDFNKRKDADNYEFLSEYIDYKSKMLIRSKNCGHVYYSTPNRLLSGVSTCPICHKSMGEDRILNYLEQNNIQYEKEKSYSDLIGLGGGHLRYDYLVFCNDKSILIEYQGEQHERYIKGLHKDKEVFVKQQKHDKMKIEYAQKINIPLLHIWYYDFDKIEEILEREFSKITTVA